MRTPTGETVRRSGRASVLDLTCAMARSVHGCQSGIDRREKVTRRRLKTVSKEDERRQRRDALTVLDRADKGSGQRMPQLLLREPERSTPTTYLQTEPLGRGRIEMGFTNT